MADLNDFFAKKDKKKSKGFRFATANEIDKKLQEPNQKREEPEIQDEDSEWKEFEDIKKDYTGLKIQNTIISDPVEVVVNEVKVLEVIPFAWKTTAPTQETKSNLKEDSQEKENKLNNNNTSTAKYVPPHLRTKYVLPHLRNKNVTSFTSSLEEPKSFQDNYPQRLDRDYMFPTLQAATSTEKHVHGRDRTKRT